MSDFKMDESWLLARSHRTPDGCWIWTGGFSGSGYPTISVPGLGSLYVHRLACELAHGLPDQPSYALHACDRSGCVNPGHLRWGTHADNMRDASERGGLRGRRHVQGSQHPLAKLSENSIRTMRIERAAGATLRSLAEAHGVSIALVGQVCARQIWRHVDV